MRRENKIYEKWDNAKIKIKIPFIFYELNKNI